MGRSSLQGTPWHTVNRWELKEKDEFGWYTKEEPKEKKVKKKTNNKKTIYKGFFIIQFQGEEEQEYIIGENISNDAEMVKIVSSSEEGEEIIINDEKALLVKKNVFIKI